MATDRMARLAVLLILGTVIVAPTPSVAGPGGREDAEHPGSVAVSGRLETAERAEQPEPSGEDSSASAMQDEGEWSAPSGRQVNSCDVLVAAALDAENYFSSNDFLTRLSALTQSNAGYFDANAATPTLETLLQFDMVISFTDNNWADRFEMGDVLADYVEAGGKVILGNYDHHTEGAASWLEGRIMEQYNPAFIDETRWSQNYTGDGTDCIFAGVPTFRTLPLDHVGSLIGSAGSDGTYDDGSIAAVYRLDRSVYYVPGHMGGYPVYLDQPATQAWAQLTANICYCEPEPLLGACCNPLDGTCADGVLAADCRPPLLFNVGTTCAALDPPCGNPGACCDDSTGGCTQEFERNCAGRFAAGETCSGDPFVPACGQTGTCDILYAPTDDDNKRLRDELKLLTASNVDYYDGRLGTPTLGELMQYDTVVTWVPEAFDNSVAMGNVLADFVEAGGKVILGLWSAPGGNNNVFLEGRLMEEYNPVTIGGLDWGGTTYADDGVDCIHDGVTHYSPRIYDQIVEVAPDSWSDGTYLNEAGERFPSVAYRHDRKVFYISGFDGAVGLVGGPGDWAELIANICACPTVDLFGACCDAATGSCTDDVLPTDCLPPLQWSYDTLCADLSPQCGNPGACCDDVAGSCTVEVELACDGRFRPGQTCESLPFDPPCGDYAPCAHSIVMRDDGGDGWRNSSVDVYVSGFPVLTGVALEAGTGPESVFFPAEDGELITTVWNPGFNDFEESYCIAGLDGSSILCDGVGGEFPTGVNTLGDCTEVACGNGICQIEGGESCANCVQDCGDCGCVSQLSLQAGAYLSDLDCQACSSGLQIMADNFRLFAETQVLGVRFPGTYTPDGIPSEPDKFTVVFRANGEGPPGAVIASSGSVTGTRTAIGPNEYEYFINVDVTLPAGSYWLEIFNDTTGSDESWAWFAGELNPTYGLPGLAYSLAMPEIWGFNGSLEMAYGLVCSAEVTNTVDKSNDDVRIHWNAVGGYTYDVLHTPLGGTTWTREENVLPPWHHVGVRSDGQDYSYRVEAILVSPPSP